MQTQYYCYKCSINTTDYPVIKVHVDERSSARIWQHKLCVTLSANVNINLPIKVYNCICTIKHIRIEIIHGSQNVFWPWVGWWILVFYTEPNFTLNSNLTYRHEMKLFFLSSNMPLYRRWLLLKS